MAPPHVGHPPRQVESGSLLLQDFDERYYSAPLLGEIHAAAAGQEKQAEKALGKAQAAGQTPRAGKGKAARKDQKAGKTSGRIKPEVNYKDAASSSADDDSDYDDREMVEVGLGGREGALGWGTRWGRLSTHLTSPTLMSAD